MRSFAVVAALAGIASAVPAAVTGSISPSNEKTPDGCQTSYSGKFEVAVQKLAKRSLETRADSPMALTLTLKDGVLTDSLGRIGYIASNRQFQFDNPVQAGAIYTAGFSVCANNSIALGDSAIFYQCLTDDYYNLYDENSAAQCNAAYLNAIPVGTAATSAVATGVHTVACQITDGQVQQNTCLTTVTAAPTLTQIADGQPQAPTNVVTQLSDGQPQAPTNVVTQLSDGQPQAPTGVVTQLSDGQPQAPTGVVTQLTDGQPQAPVTPTMTSKAALSTGAIVTQISDGQPQAGNSSAITTGTPAATVAPASGDGASARNNFGSELFGLFAAVGAVAFFL